MTSPVGDLRIVEHDGAITAIEFSPFRDHDGRPRGDRDDTNPVLVETRAPARARTSTATSRSSTCRSTRAAREFQQPVWAAAAEIGYGDTASYGEIAKRLGKIQRRLARGRPGQRQQPDPDRHPVPPGDRRRTAP